MSLLFTITVDERVQRGIKMLDEVRPGWRESIDLDTLALADCEQCVLGQVFREEFDDFSSDAEGFFYSDPFTYGVDVLCQETYCPPSSLGFDGRDDDMWELQAAWERALLAEVRG